MWKVKKNTFITTVVNIFQPLKFYYKFKNMSQSKSFDVKTVVKSVS